MKEIYVICHGLVERGKGGWTSGNGRMFNGKKVYKMYGIGG